MSLARGTHNHVLDLALLNPTAAQLGLRGSTVHAYGHVLPGLLGGTHPHTLWIFWNICTRFSFSLLCHMGLSGILSNTSSACCWPCSFFMGLWVPTLAVLLSSRPFGTCFIQHSAHSLDVSSSHPPHPVISTPTSLSESLLLFNPWNQLNSDVTGFGNTQASQENANHIFHSHRDVHCSVDEQTESAAPPQC